MLQSLGSQRVGHDLATEQQQYQILVVLEFHPELSLLEATYFSFLSSIFNPTLCFWSEAFSPLKSNYDRYVSIAILVLIFHPFL